jgi:hypothetical protein
MIKTGEQAVPQRCWSSGRWNVSYGMPRSFPALPCPPLPLLALPSSPSSFSRRKTGTRGLKDLDSTPVVASAASHGHSTGSLDKHQAFLDAAS